MKPSDILCKALELFEPKDSWIQGFSAGERTGPDRFKIRDPGDPAANCFCLYGAIHHAYIDQVRAHGDLSELALFSATEYVAYQIIDKNLLQPSPRRVIQNFNDGDFQIKTAITHVIEGALERALKDGR